MVRVHFLRLWSLIAQSVSVCVRRGLLWKLQGFRKASNDLKQIKMNFINNQGNIQRLQYLFKKKNGHHKIVVKDGLQKKKKKKLWQIVKNVYKHYSFNHLYTHYCVSLQLSDIAMMSQYIKNWLYIIYCVLLCTYRHTFNNFRFNY